MDPARKQELLKRYLEHIAPENSLESMEADSGVQERLQVAPGTAREKRAAAEGLKRLRHGQDLTPSQMGAMEAIILPGERPVVDVISGSFSQPEAPFAHFGSGQIRTHIENAIPCVGRIELPDNPALPYGGTGFVVGEKLLMTNRHVAELFAQGLGRQGLQFKPGESAGIDFKRENQSHESQFFEVSQILMIHPYWDMALLEVQGLELPNGPLTLAVDHPDDLAGKEIAVIGYPALDPRNNVDLQNRIFRRVFNVKRLQPGNLRQRASISSFRKRVNALTHDSSTLGGNSGSAVIDVGSGKVVALHFAGLYLEANYAVPAFDLARDGRVVDAGVNFESSIGSGPTEWEEHWLRADPPPAESGAASTLTSRIDLSPPPPAQSDYATATFRIPLEITVRVGSPAPPSVADGGSGTAVADQLERMVEPFREESYDNRSGFDEDFLDIRLRPPQATDLTAVAELEDGSHLIPYEHFSIVMHKQRRLALFAASNVDADPEAKRPEPGRDYTRRGLSGLGPNDREKWFQDPRIRGLHQLPDRFFTRDRGSFDKGHIVRRDDVAWGRTYDEVRRANGDTYHVTNCSPQVAGFNRSQAGGIWGKLENLILRQAKAEKYSVFAGPVLDPNDRVFRGRDLQGDVRVQIPSRYWKIVVAREDDRLQSFAFLLEQDLSNTDLEFAVPEDWESRMIGIDVLESVARQVRFPEAVHNSDQFDTDSGESLRGIAGLEKFRG